MNREIFELDLGVVATSLYILICAHSEESQPATLKKVRQYWNGGEEQLQQGLSILINRGILRNTLPISNEEPLLIAAYDQWIRA